MWCLCGLEGDSDAASDGPGGVASGAEGNDPDTEMVSQHPDDLRTVRHFFGGLLRLLNTGLRPARVPGGWLHCRWGMCQARLLLASPAVGVVFVVDIAPVGPVLVMRDSLDPDLT